jgi:hypothetical protein
MKKKSPGAVRPDNDFEPGPEHRVAAMIARLFGGLPDGESPMPITTLKKCRCTVLGWRVCRQPCG